MCACMCVCVRECEYKRGSKRGVMHDTRKRGINVLCNHFLSSIFIAIRTRMSQLHNIALSVPVSNPILDYHCKILYIIM